MSIETSPPFSRELKAGQSLQFFAVQNSSICMLSGTIEVCAAPQILGNVLWQQRQNLVSGCVYVVPITGWMTISAIQHSQIRIHQNYV